MRGARAALVSLASVLFLTAAAPHAGVRSIDVPEGWFDEVFAPPTEEEIAAARADFGEGFSCPRFEIKEELRGDDAAEAAGSGTQVNGIEYESAGLNVTGLMAAPAEGGPFPVIILNHGGFSGITRYDLITMTELAERGYVVLASTYRGEEGLAGESEGEMDVLGGEVTDVLNLVECAKRLEGTTGRVGMLGGSHGGGITLLALERGGGVDAAVTFAAPADMFNAGNRKLAQDWVTNPGRQEMMLALFMTDDALKRMKAVFGWTGGEPAPVQEVRRNLLMRSALYFVERIETPLLFFYGERDPVVSVEDARRLAERLEEHGKEFDYRIFPGQGHSLTDEKKREAYAMVHEFFDALLKGGAAAPGGADRF
ncbi:MAG: prolyl oligopeptidase family serine peptidase [bacterium]